MIYFIVFCFLIVCIYTYDYSKYSKGNIIAYGLFWIFFVAIMGLRYRIGGDSVMYEAEFKNLPTLDHLYNFKFGGSRYEPGYIVFCSIARSLSPDFTYFQLLHSFVVNTVVFWFIYKNTPNRYIALTLYFGGLYFNLGSEVLREALAVCCLLLAWPFFKNGKWLIYFIFAFFAASFHISGAIMFVLPLFVLPGIRRCFRLGWPVLLVSLVIFAAGMILEKKFFVILQQISDNENIMQKAQMYQKSDYGGLNLNFIGMLEHALKTIIIPLGALYYMKHSLYSGEDEEKLKWLKRLEILIVTGVYFAVLAMTITIAGRFNNYIGLFNYILIASCFFRTIKIKRKRFRLNALYWACIFAVIFILNIKVYFGTFGATSLKQYMLYYPYISRLDPQDDTNRETIHRLLIHLR